MSKQLELLAPNVSALSNNCYLSSLTRPLKMLFDIRQHHHPDLQQYKTEMSFQKTPSQLFVRQTMLFDEYIIDTGKGDVDKQPLILPWDNTTWVLRAANIIIRPPINEATQLWSHKQTPRRVYNRHMKYFRFIWRFVTISMKAISPQFCGQLPRTSMS